MADDWSEAFPPIEPTKADDHRDPPLDEVLGILRYLSCRIDPCGSRVTCDPPPTDTDIDFLVHVLDDGHSIRDVVFELSSSGFTREGRHIDYGTEDESIFSSWRRGNENILLTPNYQFAAKHRTATYVCKRLNLLKKDDRITVFQAVLYGNEWDGKGQAPREVSRDCDPQDEIRF